MSTDLLQPRQPAQRSWTAEQIRELGTRTDLVTAYKIVIGGGKNRAWQAYHDGELPFTTLRCGRRVVVPVASILAALHLDQIPQTDIE